jgi:hypothetical protein
VLNSMEANPSVKQPNEAAVHLSKMLYGLGRLRQASVLTFQAAKKREGLTRQRLRGLASRWSRDQDPRAYMADLMTAEQRKKLSDSIKPGTTQAKKFRETSTQRVRWACWTTLRDTRFANGRSPLWRSLR